MKIRTQESTMTTHDVPTIGNCRLGKAAELLGLEYQGMYAAVTRGDIPSVRIGRTMAIPWAWIRTKLMVADSEGQIVPLETLA